MANDHLGQPQIDCKMLSISREIILVADHTQCGRIASGRLASLLVPHTFVTDTQKSPEFTSANEEQGIRVLAV